MLKENAYKVIVFILAIVVLGLGTVLFFNMTKDEEETKVVENDKMFEQSYSQTVLEREIGSTEWTRFINEDNHDLYLALEKSNNNYTIKGKLVNNSNEEIKRLVLVKYITINDSLDIMPVQGKEGYLGRSETSNTMDFEFTFDVSNLTSDQKLNLSFMITVLDDGQDYQYIYSN